MLPACNRLSRQELSQLLRSGKRTQIGPFICISSEASERTKASFFVPKRIEKHATQRNLLKRQLSMAFFTTLSEWKNPRHIYCKVVKPIQNPGELPALIKQCIREIS